MRCRGSPCWDGVQSASICSRRSGSNPIITSSPITRVGVERLLYLCTRSSTAAASREISRSSYAMPLSERWALTNWHGGQPGCVKTTTFLLGLMAVSELIFLKKSQFLKRTRSRKSLWPSSAASPTRNSTFLWRDTPRLPWPCARLLRRRGTPDGWPCTQ